MRTLNIPQINISEDAAKRKSRQGPTVPTLRHAAASAGSYFQVFPLRVWVRLEVNKCNILLEVVFQLSTFQAHAIRSHVRIWFCDDAILIFFCAVAITCILL